MARRKQTRGTCAFCGREMTRGGLTRHLDTCVEHKAAIEAANQGRGREQPLYHLVARDAWGGDYWLHLEVNGLATLNDLDRYLRAIWLECCGHLSRFSIGGWRGDEIPMSRQLAYVIAAAAPPVKAFVQMGTASTRRRRYGSARRRRSCSERMV